MSAVFRAVVTLALMAAVAAVASPTATATSGGATQTYIVVLQPGTSSVRAEASSLARQHGGRVGFVYEHALRGFSITASAASASALARNPRVAFVEADRVVTLDAQTTPTGLGRVFAADSDPTTTLDTGYNANLDIDGTDDLRVDVDVAVIDTGIDLDNPDLNVVGGVNCLSGSCVSGGDDDHYHGTHVAGTVAALDNSTGVVGVAPGARLWAVKVLDRRGSGTWSGVIAGINWVAGSWAIGSGRDPIEVANMSLGGGKSGTVNLAVANAVGAGVTMVVAAGNESANAANYSPASEPKAITVSALADFNGLPGGGASATCRADVDDTFADFSNYGSVVDMIAPGVCITSTNNNSTTLRTISGTSMASPHVAGAAALLRSMSKSGVQTEADLKSTGNSGWSVGSGVTDDGVVEPLLDVRNSTVFAPVMVAPSPPPPPDPTFSGSAKSGAKSTWSATVSVTNAGVGAVIIGTWNTGGTPNSCTADTTGACKFTLRELSKSATPSVTWTYSDDSSKSVTITKP